MDIKGPSAHVSLKGSNDWHQWISVVRKYATNQGIWAYIDPKQPNKVDIVEPVKPDFTDIKPAATSLADLDETQFKRLESLKIDYRLDLRTYQWRLKALLVIQEFIIKTTGNYYNTIIAEDSVPRQLELLQARLQPTSWELERDVFLAR